MIIRSFLFSVIILVNTIAQAVTQNVRFPSVSGSFYPSDSQELTNMIQGFLKKVPSSGSQQKKIIGLILPHAGYIYSGQTAAYGYNLLQTSDLQNTNIETVIIIGPYHQKNFSGVSIWASGSWVTPLGSVSIDEELAQALQKENPDFKVSQDLHLKEHSIETHIPFLQVVLPKAKLVPILISNPAYAWPLAQALAQQIKGNKRILVIASTDMSHYYPETMARRLDKTTLELLHKQDLKAVAYELEEGNIQLCGGAAVLVLLKIAQILEAEKFKTIHYTTSAETTHDPKSVVGYSTSVIYQDNTQSHLSRSQKETLLNIAKETLTTFIQLGKKQTFDIHDPKLLEKKAVFVTLRDKKGNLRGCIGRTEPEEPLFLATQNMTIEAATQDSRFPPVKPDELKDLTIEISILGLPNSIKTAQDIVFGHDGVVVEQGGKHGLFLPEVAESFQTKEDFLSELCEQKAKLPRSCWQDPATKISVFTTENFGEKDIRKKSS